MIWYSCGAPILPMFSTKLKTSPNGHKFLLVGGLSMTHGHWIFSARCKGVPFFNMIYYADLWQGLVEYGKLLPIHAKELDNYLADPTNGLAHYYLPELYQG